MRGSFSQPNGHVLVRDYAVGDSAQVSANDSYHHGSATGIWVCMLKLLGHT